MSAHPPTLSRRAGIAQNRTTEMKAAFDWALQMMGLLRRIYDVLSATVKAWRTFQSPDGDIGYFIDLELHVASRTTKRRYRSLQNLKAMFRQLEEYQEKLFTLNNSCLEYQGTVSPNASFLQLFGPRQEKTKNIRTGKGSLWRLTAEI